MRVLCAFLVAIGAVVVAFGEVEEVSGLPAEHVSAKVPTRC